MKKLFKLIVFLVFLLFVAAGVGLFFLDSLIKTAVNTYGGEVTQTEVKLDDVSLSYLNAHASLAGLMIGSPKGFSAPYIFKLGKISVDVDKKTLLKDVIVINKIEISDVGVIYELAGTKSNLSALNNSISRYAGSSGASSSKSVEKSGGSSKKIFIKELTITGAQAGLESSFGGTTVNLPNLTLRNIGDSGKGTDLGTAMAKVLDSFTTQVMKAIASSPLVDKAAELSSETLSKAKDAASKASEGVTDSLKSLFNK